MSFEADSRKPSDIGAPPVEIHRLTGPQPYIPTWEHQQRLAGERARGERPDLLLLLEHEHVYTNGWQGKREHLLASDQTLRKIGAAYHEIERGGDITYHGPGQLVGYSILHLRSAGLGVRQFVGMLEQVVILTLAHYGVPAHTKPGIVGVWVGDEKIGAIGVKVRKGVSYHGFALNVDPNLDYFDHIVPCGLPNAGVTSLARTLGRPVSVEDVVPVCAEAFGSVFERRLVGVGSPAASVR